MEQVGAVVDTWPNGIYFGFAFLHGHIYKAVASIGTNPYFKNSQKVRIYTGCSVKQKLNSLGPFPNALSYLFVVSLPSPPPSIPPPTQTVEPHLLHDFPDDFYGEDLKFLVCGYVRPEASFPSLDELVTAIHNDIAFARTALEEPEWREFASSKLEWTKTESAA
jgi:FAD synthase